MNTYNPILDVDSYKSSHYGQYPKEVTNVYSYIEARSNAEFNDVVFFGLQHFLKKYLTVPFVSCDMDEAAKVLTEKYLAEVEKNKILSQSSKKIDNLLDELTIESEI